MTTAHDSTSDTAPADKPRYEPPTFMPLGELARGEGACRAGSGEGKQCDSGASAKIKACASGQDPNTFCFSGGTFGGGGPHH